MVVSPNLHLIMSDVHANIFALRAVVEYGQKAKVKHWRHTGDLVGYGCFPRECIQTFRQLEVLSASGNHDYALFCNQLSWDPAWLVIDRAQRELTADEVDYMRCFRLSLKEGDRYFVHKISWKDFCDGESRLVFRGHTHIPAFSRCVEDRTVKTIEIKTGINYLLDPQGKYIVNPGSVGFPRNGDPRASFVLYDPDANSLTWVRVEYDYAEFIRAMRERKYPREVIDRFPYCCSRRQRKV